jgi:hypothetical protein
LCVIKHHDVNKRKKVKVSLNLHRKHRRGVEIYLHPARNLALLGWLVVKVTPLSLYLREEDPLPILQVAAWAPVPFWTGVVKRKYLVYPGVRNSARQYT